MKLEKSGERSLPPEYPAIAEEIMRMAEADQKMRRAAATGEAWDPETDIRNTKRMREIVTEIGWPTIRKIGPQASKQAWLLVQHADHDLPFQKESLALMQAAPPGEVIGCNIAYLEDRIATHEGRPQLYGTQFSTNDEGLLEPYPIADPEKLDERRASYGLEPFAEYAKWADDENARRKEKSGGL